jgi:hypothetical protein
MAKSKTKSQGDNTAKPIQNDIKEHAPDMTFKPSSLNFNKDSFFEKTIMHRSNLSDTKKLPFERFLSSEPTMKLEAPKKQNPDADTSLYLSIVDEQVPLAAYVQHDLIAPALVPILTDHSSDSVIYPSERLASSKPVMDLTLYDNCKINDLKEGQLSNMVSIEQLSDYFIRSNLSSATNNLYQKLVLNDFYQGTTSPISSTISRLLNQDLTTDYGYSTKLQRVVKQEANRILSSSLPSISKEWTKQSGLVKGAKTVASSFKEALDKMLEVDEYAQLTVNVVLPVYLMISKNKLSGKNTSAKLRTFYLSAKVTTYLRIVYDNQIISPTAYSIHNDNWRVESSELFNWTTLVLEKPTNLKQEREFFLANSYNNLRPSISVLTSSTDQEHKQIKEIFSDPSLSFDIKYDALISQECARTIFSCVINTADDNSFLKNVPSPKLSTLLFNVKGNAGQICTSENVKSLYNKEIDDEITTTITKLDEATMKARFIDLPTCDDTDHSNSCELCYFLYIQRETERLTQDPCKLIAMLNSYEKPLVKSTNDHYQILFSSLFKDRDFIDIISSLAMLINLNLHLDRLHWLPTAIHFPGPASDEILPQGTVSSSVDKFASESIANMRNKGFSALAEGMITNYINKLEKSLKSTGVDPTLAFLFVIGSAVRALSTVLYNRSVNPSEKAKFFFSKQQTIAFTKKTQYSPNEITDLSDKLNDLPLFTKLLQWEDLNTVFAVLNEAMLNPSAKIN